MIQSWFKFKADSKLIYKKSKWCQSWFKVKTKLSQNWVEIESKLIQSWFIKSQNGVKVESKWSQSWFKVKTNLSQSYWVKVESMLKNEFRKRLNFFNFLAKLFFEIRMLIFGMKIQIFCNLTFKLHCYKMRLFSWFSNNVMCWWPPISTSLLLWKCISFSHDTNRIS